MKSPTLVCEVGGDITRGLLRGHYVLRFTSSETLALVLGCFPNVTSVLVHDNLEWALEILSTHCPKLKRLYSFRREIASRANSFPSNQQLKCLSSLLEHLTIQWVWQVHLRGRSTSTLLRGPALACPNLHTLEFRGVGTEIIANLLGFVKSSSPSTLNLHVHT
eukprot:TRINITY_DN879_c0_g1_i15.p1 TRINITY_DN879_c0_g1~~TRINITY_DN879_c0_g1_i15.p1  ORF type:complete len:163 (-),score=6.72 TRINITY_DN879_c0_g1_i15:598-1086(-)